MTVKNTTIRDWGQLYDCTPQVGRKVLVDNWQVNVTLQESKTGLGDFWLPRPYAEIDESLVGPITGRECRIEVTGRLVRASGMVRVKITLPGDGEEDTVLRGYMDAVKVEGGAA